MSDIDLLISFVSGAFGALLWRVLRKCHFLAHIRRWRTLFRVWRAGRYRGLDEFHRSLDMDGCAMLYMTEAERERYIANLIRRREALHTKGLGNGKSIH